MERLIRVGKLQISTGIPKDGCVSCSAIPGEMCVFVARAGNNLSSGEMKAQVECHAVSGGANTRHIDITLEVAGKEISASDVVRNWARRMVHCQICH